MKYSISITGSGTSAELAQALRLVADDIEMGNHINSISEKGEAEWEDPTIITTITEDNEVDEEEQADPKYPEFGKRMITTLPGFEGPYRIKAWFWNGFTYMYSFEGTSMSCGEEYLREA